SPSAPTGRPPSPTSRARQHPVVQMGRGEQLEDVQDPSCVARWRRCPPRSPRGTRRICLQLNEHLGY
ncbi:hypothetical protein B0H19DRAFT_1117809, partial [Mycena capillaripes]